MITIETVDGSQIFNNVYTTSHGTRFEFLIREDGSVSLYSPQESYHAVVFDSLDGKPPTLRARHTERNCGAVLPNYSLAPTPPQHRSLARQKPTRSTPTG